MEGLGRKRGVVFDLDMTLVDSSEAITATLNAVARELGLRGVSREEVIPLIGMPLEESMRELWGFCDGGMLSLYRRLFWEHEGSLLRAMDGAEGVLRDLKALGLSLGILSNRKDVKLVLEHLGLSGYFDGVWGMLDVPEPKPSPRALEHVLEALGLSREEALFVGDSMIDARCAREAGVDFLGVATGAYGVSDFEREGFRAVSELKGIVELLGR